MYKKRTLSGRVEVTAKQADLFSADFQLSEAVERNENARFSTVRCATPRLWVRVCRFNFGIGQRAAEMKVCRVCESRSIDATVALPRPGTGVLLKRHR